MFSKRVTYWMVVGVAVLMLAACRGAAVPEEPTRAGPTPPGAGLPVSRERPDVENNAPAGICEDTANILSRVDRVPEGLFRALALDNRVGVNDGDGIRGVRFVVVGENLNYARDETTAPYCVFGGNEPDCGPWPRDDEGRYTWGVGGPVVESGSYQVFVEVVGEQPDSLSGRDRCEWNFSMQVEAH